MISTKLLPAWMLLAAVGCSSAQPVERPQNVILFISDGCGPASFTFAREYKRSKGWGGLAVDEHLIGSSGTFAADSRVTDSAASGTAMACGVKTDNGVISLDTAGMPVGTILEAAEERGMATGLVATSTISHATPAAFSAHVLSRADQDEIVRQQLDQGIEILLGGGAEFFLPASEGGRRDDDQNLFDTAGQNGYHVARNREEFLAAVSGPLLGIFNEGHMSYEIDRDTTLEPSLVEMTRRAIDLLDDHPEGFFLMVEGSKIDHAGHGNDAVAHLHEILQFDAAFGVAVEYAAAHGRTLVVSTSDHETGGLSLGRDGVYEWWPEVIDRVPASVTRLVQLASESALDKCEFLETELDIGCSSDDSLSVLASDSMNVWDRERVVGNIISRAAGIGWSSAGHTAVDVNVYAFGPSSELFRGHQDNTMIGQNLARIMDFDLAAVTSRLRSRAESSGQ